MATSRSCLSTDELVAYVEGSPVENRTELDRHVEGCDACRAGVAAVVRAGRKPPAKDGDSTITMTGLSALANRPVTSLAGGPTAYTSATLREEEIATAHTMIVMGRVVGLAALAPVPFLGGNVVVAIVFATTVAIAIAVGVVLERNIRAHRYSEVSMLYLALLVVCAGLVGTLYYGIFSAAQLFPVLTIYVFSRRERVDFTLAIYLLTAAGQAVIAAIVISGVVADPGLFEPSSSPAFLIVGHVLIQIGDLATFLVGRQSRDATRAAINNMQQAMVLAARREVLLQEAREALDRAMQIGGPGRYTDHTFGAYRLGNILGRGGMGEVYEAFHTTTNEPAAVKLLPLRELANSRSVERFMREVRAVSALRSNHVVRVLGASDERDPIPYLVMERLHGQTLAQWMREVPAPEQLLELLGQVGDAIEEAWECGIVHRDLKPQNLFRAERPTGAIWKVLDFGVAALSDHAGTLTQGHVVGTPAYMAPEQARGEQVDAGADLYALSAIAYRWLTGQPVCSGGDVRTSLYQVVHAAPKRPTALAALDPDVDAVLAIGLAKNSADRWKRVTDLRAALAQALLHQLDPDVRQRAAELLLRHPWAEP